MHEGKAPLKRLHKETYSGKDLYLYEEKAPKKIAANTLHYKYFITHHASGYTAFSTKAGLDRWFKDTGLKEIPNKKGWLGNPLLYGKYTEISMSGSGKKLDDFGKKHSLRKSMILSNGEYTTAYVKEGRNGNTIYYLNPNYPRAELPYIHE